MIEVKSGHVQRWTQLTDLSFNGERFTHHSMELEVGQELATFQRLVTDVAGDIWRRENPDRERLPAGFELLTKLRFSQIKQGSATLPLESPVESDGDSIFGEQPSPHLAQALSLIIDAIRSQHDQRELPSAFPRNRIGRVIELGETLREDESISVGDVEKRIKKQATLSKATRQRFREYESANYDDVLTLYGEIRAVDLDGPTALLRLPDHTRIRVAFTNDQSDIFKRYLNHSVALEGVAEISKMDGFIRKVRSVTELSIIESSDGEDSFLRWLQTQWNERIWASLPTDAAANLDKYLYSDNASKSPSE